MSVQGTIELTDPDTAEASLTLTMTVGEWKKVRAALRDNSAPWAESETTRIIDRLIKLAEQHQWASSDGRDGP